MEDKLTPQDGLHLIEEMISKAKNSYHENGTSALLWGSTVMLCSAVSFFNVWWQAPLLNYIWLLTFLAVVPQIFISIHEEKSKPFKTHTSDAMGGIWMSFGIAIFLATFYGNVLHPKGFGSIYLILYGMPTFATGITHRYKPMILGGIICWICAIISFYTNDQVDMVLFFVTALTAWFIPGLMLRSRFVKAKKQHV